MKALRDILRQYDPKQALTAFRNLWTGLGRVFGPPATPQPKTGLRPLTSDIYRPSRHHRMAW